MSDCRISEEDRARRIERVMGVSARLEEHIIKDGAFWPYARSAYFERQLGAVLHINWDRPYEDFEAGVKNLERELSYYEC